MPRPDPELELLSQVDLFQGLTPKELKTVRGQAKAISYRPDEVVAAEGDRGGRLYLIMSGEAKVDVRGRYRASLGPGDYFGEISLIDGRPRSATVTAVTDLQTLSIASFNFRALMKEQPLLPLKLLAQLCQRIRSTEQSQLH
jgi:CRP/FNR family transcriptional regulator, cyclic AMP receptor protein